MITKVEPTAGAIKAAIALRKEISGKSIWAQMFIDGQGCNDKHDRIIQTTAELIDRETAAPEMLEVLEALLDIAPLATDEASKNIHKRAIAAIRKARGE